jgi:hypothetical protein
MEVLDTLPRIADTVADAYLERTTEGRAREPPDKQASIG